MRMGTTMSDSPALSLGDSIRAAIAYKRHLLKLRKAGLFECGATKVHRNNGSAIKITHPVVVIVETKEWTQTCDQMRQLLEDRYGIVVGRSCVVEAITNKSAIAKRFHVVRGLLGDPLEP